MLLRMRLLGALFVALEANQQLRRLIRAAMKLFVARHERRKCLVAAELQAIHHDAVPGHLSAITLLKRQHRRLDESSAHLVSECFPPELRAQRAEHILLRVENVNKEGVSVLPSVLPEMLYRLRLQGMARGGGGGGGLLGSRRVGPVLGSRADWLRLLRRRLLR